MFDTEIKPVQFNSRERYSNQIESIAESEQSLYPLLDSQYLLVVSFKTITAVCSFYTLQINLGFSANVFIDCIIILINNGKLHSILTFLLVSISSN